MGLSYANFQRCLALVQEHKFEQAKAILMRALQGDPKDPQSHHGMAFVLVQMGKHEQALFYAERAVALAPGDAVYWNTLGAALDGLGRQAEAERALLKAIEIMPDLDEARITYSNVLWTLNRCDESIVQLERVLEHTPGDAATLGRIGTKLALIARGDEAVRRCSAAIRAGASDPGLHRALVSSMLYAPGVTPSEIREAHTAFGGAIARDHPPSARSFTNSREPDRRLRVGLMSPDFRKHSVAYFVEPVVEHLPGEGFDVVLYAASPQEDEVTLRLKRRAGGFRRVAGESTDAIVAAVIRDRVDMLIDLAGHTFGGSMEVFSRRAAPVQATYCGYPCTTGLPGMDWRIVDTITDPPGAERWCTERLTRVEECFLCYRPDPSGPAPTPRVPNSPAVTFASFNTPAKLNHPLLAVWARILRACPGSRLILKGIQFEDERFREEIRSRIAAGGVESGRIDILTYVKDSAEHLRAYERVDIGLDPFPYTGTTTTCEALWMGVPVVTLAGTMHHERVGASLLTTVGLRDLIAGSVEEYVRLAAALAGDAHRLAELRGSLRARVSASALVDGPGFARRFGRTLREMWSAYCEGARSPARA